MMGRRGRRGEDEEEVRGGREKEGGERGRMRRGEDGGAGEEEKEGNSWLWGPPGAESAPQTILTVIFN